MRSDRSGDRFCLVVFTLRDDATAHATHLRLARLLHRLRLTDEAGWLDRRRVGVVLPATGPQGAWKVADDIRAHFAPGFEPQCKVYFYPSDPVHFDHAGRELRSHSSSDEPPVEALEALFMQRLPLWKCDRRGGGVDWIGDSQPAISYAGRRNKNWLTRSGVFQPMAVRCGGKPFLMYKFRSMCLDAETLKTDLRALSEQDGPAFKLKDDPRVMRLVADRAAQVSMNCRNFGTCCEGYVAGGAAAAAVRRS